MKRKRPPTQDLETLIPLLIGIFRRSSKKPGPEDRLQTREFREVVSGIKTLQENLSRESTSLGHNYFEKPELLRAYLLYQFVIHYQEGLSVIGELPTPPKRVLDVCSGPAPYALAALKHGATEVIATDKNITALELGAEVSGRMGYPLSIREWNCLKKSLPVEGEFDLIILSHALTELFSEDQRSLQEKFIQSLLDRLSPEGFLLITDSSMPSANKRLLELRDSFARKNIAIQAPCIWKGPCPALQAKNSPCYAQRPLEKPYLIKEFQRAAEINLSSLKFSYIIFKSPKSSPANFPDKNLYRIISPPIDSFQGKGYYLCGTDGKKFLSSHLSSHPPESRSFAYLKRGELISIEHALEKQNALDIIEGTKVTIEAALGKPFKQPAE